MIQGGVDVDGDGSNDLDASRIYYLGQSQGASHGFPAVAYTSAIRASSFIVPFTELSGVRAMSPNRAVIGALLAARTPSLLNPANGLTSYGGIAVPAPFYNENMPLRGQPPLIDNVPGAMAIRQFIDRLRWRMQGVEATAFIARIRKDPPPGISARPTMLWVARTDTSVPNPFASELIRAGELKDRTVYYRHDLFYAANPVGNLKNPHTLWRVQSDVTKPISVAIQEQFSQFFATDGATISQTSPYFDIPIPDPLPEDFSFIP
jgi:hypothetical protein